MNITEATKLEELERIKRELKELMPLLSKWRVEELQQVISAYYMKTWKRKHLRKYGSVSKAFSQEELDRFFAGIKDARFNLLFRYQSTLGLRIGEVCVLNLKDFNFETRELRIKTEKAHTLDVLKIPSFLYEQTLSFCKENARGIEAHEGYLFYPDQQGHSSEPHINPNYTRTKFRYYASMAGLDDVYDTTDESVEGRAKRRLHRLSSHSLRHYAITTFNRAIRGDIVLTSKYARHREISSTQVYIHTSKEELYNAIDTAFSEKVAPIRAKVGV